MLEIQLTVTCFGLCHTLGRAVITLEIKGNLSWSHCRSRNYECDFLFKQYGQAFQLSLSLQYKYQPSKRVINLYISKIFVSGTFHMTHPLIRHSRHQTNFYARSLATRNFHYLTGRRLLGVSASTLKSYQGTSSIYYEYFPRLHWEISCQGYVSRSCCRGLAGLSQDL